MQPFENISSLSQGILNSDLERSKVKRATVNGRMNRLQDKKWAHDSERGNSEVLSKPPVEGVSDSSNLVKTSHESGLHSGVRSNYGRSWFGGNRLEEARNDSVQINTDTKGPLLFYRQPLGRSNWLNEIGNAARNSSKVLELEPSDPSSESKPGTKNSSCINFDRSTDEANRGLNIIEPSKNDESYHRFSYSTQHDYPFISDSSGRIPESIGSRDLYSEKLSIARSRNQSSVVNSTETSNNIHNIRSKDSEYKILESGGNAYDNLRSYRGSRLNSLSATYGVVFSSPSFFGHNTPYATATQPTLVQSKPPESEKKPYLNSLAGEPVSRTLKTESNLISQDVLVDPYNTFSPYFDDATPSLPIWGNTEIPITKGACPNFPSIKAPSEPTNSTSPMDITPTEEKIIETSYSTPHEPKDPSSRRGSRPPPPYASYIPPLAMKQRAICFSGEELATPTGTQESSIRSRSDKSTLRKWAFSGSLFKSLNEKLSPSRSSKTISPLEIRPNSIMETKKFTPLSSCETAEPVKKKELVRVEVPRERESVLRQPSTKKVYSSTTNPNPPDSSYPCEPPQRMTPPPTNASEPEEGEIFASESNRKPSIVLESKVVKNELPLYSNDEAKIDKVNLSPMRYGNTLEASLKRNSEPFSFSHDFSREEFRVTTTAIVNDDTHRVNDYLLKRSLGSGTCGEVFLSVNLKTNKQYAIKCIKHSIVFRLQRSRSSESVADEQESTHDKTDELAAEVPSGKKDEVGNLHEDSIVVADSNQPSLIKKLSGLRKTFNKRKSRITVPLRNSIQELCSTVFTFTHTDNNNAQMKKSRDLLADSKQANQILVSHEQADRGRLGGRSSLSSTQNLKGSENVHPGPPVNGLQLASSTLLQGPSFLRSLKPHSPEASPRHYHGRLSIDAIEKKFLEPGKELMDGELDSVASIRYGLSLPPFFSENNMESTALGMSTLSLGGKAEGDEFDEDHDEIIKMSGIDPKILREVAIMKSIRHRHIVRLHEAILDTRQRNVYLVMQYIDGGCLLKRKKRRHANHSDFSVNSPDRRDGDDHKPFRGVVNSGLSPFAARNSTVHNLFDHNPNQNTLMCAFHSQSFGNSNSSTKSKKNEAVNTVRVEKLDRSDDGNARKEKNDVDDENGIICLCSMPSLIQTRPSAKDAAHKNIANQSSQSPFFNSSTSIHSMLSSSCNYDYEEPMYEPVPEDHLILYVRQIVSAVAYLHFKKIAHRDIKPDNILVSRDKKRIYLTDFGVSGSFRNKNDGGLECGTPLFMSPEMLQDLCRFRSSHIGVSSAAGAPFGTFKSGLPIVHSNTGTENNNQKDGSKDNSNSNNNNNNNNNGVDDNDDQKKEKDTNIDDKSRTSFKNNDEGLADTRIGPIADVWALGVTIYVMATGRHPYYGRTPEELLENINTRTLTYETINPALGDLLRSMLTLDPKKRLKLTSLLVKKKKRTEVSGYAALMRYPSARNPLSRRPPLAPTTIARGKPHSHVSNFNSNNSAKVRPLLHGSIATNSSSPSSSPLRATRVPRNSTLKPSNFTDTGSPIFSQHSPIKTNLDNSNKKNKNTFLTCSSAEETSDNFLLELIEEENRKEENSGDEEAEYEADELDLDINLPIVENPVGAYPTE